MSRTILLCIVLMILTLSVFDSRQVRAQEPQGSGNVTGVVTDPNDKPIASFAVKLYQSQPRGIDSSRGKKSIDQPPAPGQMAEKLITTVTTDAQGRFTISKLKSGGYLLKGGSKNVGFIYQEVVIEPNKTNDLGRVKLVKT